MFSTSSQDNFNAPYEQERQSPPIVSQPVNPEPRPTSMPNNINIAPVGLPHVTHMEMPMVQQSTMVAPQSMIPIANQNQMNMNVPTFFDSRQYNTRRQRVCLIHFLTSSKMKLK